MKRGQSGRLAGYLFAHEAKLGPWVAVDASAAVELLRAALAIGWEKGPFVLVPRSNENCRRLLTDHGFVERRRLRHMRRGGAGRPDNRCNSMLRQASPTGESGRRFLGATSRSRMRLLIKPACEDALGRLARRGRSRW